MAKIDSNDVVTHTTHTPHHPTGYQKKKQLTTRNEASALVATRIIGTPCPRSSLSRHSTSAATAKEWASLMAYATTKPSEVRVYWSRTEVKLLLPAVSKMSSVALSSSTSIVFLYASLCEEREDEKMRSHAFIITLTTNLNRGIVVVGESAMLQPLDQGRLANATCHSNASNELSPHITTHTHTSQHITQQQHTHPPQAHRSDGSSSSRRACASGTFAGVA